MRWATSSVHRVPSSVSWPGATPLFARSPLVAPSGREALGPSALTPVSDGYGDDTRGT